jgi:hypothetical protein
MSTTPSSLIKIQLFFVFKITNLLWQLTQVHSGRHEEEVKAQTGIG